MTKFKSTIVIAVIGVDGSGKSSLIKELNKILKKSYITIKNLHLRPYLFLTDKRTVINKPHNQKRLLTRIESFMMIIIWLIIYRIFFFINLHKKNQLIIFDRYANDLLVDNIRYQYNLSKKVTQLILNLFPEPNLWILLKAPVQIIQKRKKELPTKELKRQMKEYLNFSKKKDNMLVVNTNLKMKKNISLIIKKMKSIVI
jgi:thymidylate kinase